MKMKAGLKEAIVAKTQATKVELREVIQELWSGYGYVGRVQLQGSSVPTVIVKNIELPEQLNHPRGWNTSASHERKVKSYKVEMEWYKNFSHSCDNMGKVPNYLTSMHSDQENYLVLEDLDSAGYPVRKSKLNQEGAKVCLKWLANFHSVFLNKSPNGLWPIGSYWHLNTRKDEYETMADGRLKQAAKKIDETLNSCKYQTIIHGDAKVANFCFSEDGNNVAAVDFQYVGGGCGMKDVAYFLGSCLNEKECEAWEEELLDFYFLELKKAIESRANEINFNELENEWRRLYPIAWTDFTRFLLGWMPTHAKLNTYSDEMIERALMTIK